MSELEWPDKTNRARHHETLRAAFVALTESHPELAPYLCSECAEAFLRGDDHPEAADALFCCMTDHLETRLDPDVLGPILSRFFIFNTYRRRRPIGRTTVAR